MLAVRSFTLRDCSYKMAFAEFTGELLIGMQTVQSESCEVRAMSRLNPSHITS